MKPQYRVLTYVIIGLIVSIIALFVIPAFTVSMIVRNWGQDFAPFPYDLFFQNFRDYFWLYLGAAFGCGFIFFILLGIIDIEHYS
ncbi:MAG: hypothetical protein ACFFBP_00330 [Promethearchaeota archaeon]